MGGIELSRKQEGGDAQLGKKTEESKTSEKRARLFWAEEQKKVPPLLNQILDYNFRPE